MFPFKKPESTGFRRRYDNPSGPGKYNVILRPGYTAVVGPDWCKKEKLLEQIRRAARKAGWSVVKMEGSLFVRGSADAALEQIRKLASAAAASGATLMIVLEYPEGGASVDLLMSLRESLDEILLAAGCEPGGMEKPIYVVAATNAYALAEGICVDARDGRTATFGCYADFARSIVGGGTVRA